MGLVGIVFSKTLFRDCRDKVVWIVVGDGSHGEDFAGIGIHNDGSASSNSTENILRDVLNMSVNGELNFGTFEGGLVIVSGDDFAFFVPDENPLSTFSLKKLIHGEFNAGDSFHVALEVLVGSIVIFGNVTFGPLFDISQKVASHRPIRVNAAGHHADFNTWDFVAANGNFGKLVRSEVSSIGVGNQSSIGEVVGLNSIRKSLSGESKRFQLGNDPIPDGLYHLIFVGFVIRLLPVFVEFLFFFLILKL